MLEYCLKIVYKYVTNRNKQYSNLSNFQQVREGFLLSLLGYERKMKKKIMAISSFLLEIFFLKDIVSTTAYRP